MEPLTPSLAINSFDDYDVRTAFTVTGAVLGSLVNLAGALLGEQLSRPDGSDRTSARVFPSIAPTANFDGVTLGAGGSF